MNMSLESPMKAESIRQSLEKVSQLVEQAGQVVAPVWPLETVIACNPLQGFEEMNFEQALETAEGYRQLDLLEVPGRQAVNREMIKWCSAFLDEGQATIHMPNRSLGFYGAFRELAPYDPVLRVSAAPWGKPLALPERPEEAIHHALEKLALGPDDHLAFLQQAFLALPGWSGYVKYRQDWQSQPSGYAVSLLDLMAVRLVLTVLLWPNAKVLTASNPGVRSTLNSLTQGEDRYRKELIEKIRRAGAPAAKVSPKAQWVFCIDVRSEPFRRALEAAGPHETLGFAGFFGMPVRVQAFGEENAYDSCPVLLKPSYQVGEEAAAKDRLQVGWFQMGQKIARMPEAFYQSLKYNFTTPFALVEMLGPWFGLRMVGKTLLPRTMARFRQGVSHWLQPDLATEPLLDGIALEKQVEMGEGALRTMGLTGPFAPLVVFCGHGSRTLNNPHASSLDCGACGGRPGAPNAKILAAILNRPLVREGLAAQGIHIPEKTWFVGAQHDTTTDEVTLYPSAQLPTEVLASLARIEEDLKKAAWLNAQERSKALGVEGPKTTEAVLRRSEDWAQTRPEWGLARNAAFIVGPRALTQNLSLEGRSFLHSYEWEQDTEGRALTTILTAPMVVAQWINSQYLFSTMDNRAYGAGSKVTHNVTGKIGVMQGNASDLMHGLPLQSVFAADDRAYHEPLRLLTLVKAPRQRVQGIIEAQPVLQKLFGKGWVHLVVADPQDGQFYRRTRSGDWVQEG